MCSRRNGPSSTTFSNIKQDRALLCRPDQVHRANMKTRQADHWTRGMGVGEDLVRGRGKRRCTMCGGCPVGLPGWLYASCPGAWLCRGLNERCTAGAPNSGHTAQGLAANQVSCLHSISLWINKIEWQQGNNYCAMT